MLAGHSFEHEIAMATSLGILGSVDANRNDYQSGWDTDQFPNNVPEMAVAMYYILKSGGLTTGGFNFDSKIRRQSIEPVDLIHGHVGGMDVCARALKAAAKMIEDNVWGAYVEERYAGWNSRGGQGDALRQALAGRDRRAGRGAGRQSEAALRRAGISGECHQPLCLSLSRKTCPTGHTFLHGCTDSTALAMRIQTN